MASIVLVHGAWGGSYGFRQVRPLLAAAGHDVFTPSLTGIGERSHLAHPNVDLDLHVQDIRNTIFYEDLDDIVLLGFSYGGMVVTGLLDDLAAKVRHLVYLDAFVPDDGQSAAAIIGGPLEERATTTSDWSLPPIPRQLETPEATAWSDARRANQPVKTLTQPVSLNTPIEELDLTRTYIKATSDPAEPTDSPFWNYARHAEASPAWEYHQIETNHMVPMTRPAELATILLDLAAR